MIRNSELILKPNGSIYHLGLKEEHITDTIITVGDPDRVTRVGKHFNKILFETQNREFHSIKGIYNGHEVLVISTGIGTDNIDIVFTELDACVNVDFATRQPKTKLKELSFVRIGTSGGLIEEVPIGSFLASSYGLGLDGLMNFYDYEKLSEEKIQEEELNSQLSSMLKDVSIYVSKGDEDLLKKFQKLGFLSGMTITSPGFYGPQGRVIRMSLKHGDFLTAMANTKLPGVQITNLEMETSAMYGMARALGHKAMSLNAILANRATGEFVEDTKALVDALIEKTLAELFK